MFSYINTMLRDRYASLDAFCADTGADREALVKTLADAGFEYIPAVNQFR